MNLISSLQFIGIIGVAAGIIITAFQKPTQGQIIILFLMMCIGLITLGGWFYTNSQSIEGHIISKKLAYLGDCWIYFLMFLYFLYYFQIDIPKPIYILLFILSSALTFITLDIDYISIQYIMENTKQNTAAQPVNLRILYIFMVLFYNITLFFISAWKIVRNKKLNKKGPILIFTAIFIPTFFHIISWLGIKTFNNISSVSVTLSGIILVYTLISSNTLNINDIARNAVFSSLHDGLILTDNQFHLKDTNKIAIEIFPELSKLKNINLKNSIYTISTKLSNIIKNQDYSFIEYNKQIYQPAVKPIIEKSNLSGYIIWLFDITDSINNNKVKFLNEKRMQIIYEQIDDIIFELNLLDNSITCSPMFEKKFGYKADKIITLYEKENEHIHPDDFSFVKNCHDKLYHEKDFIDIEYRIKKIFNNQVEYIWCRHRATSLKDENNVPYLIIGLITDINQQKQELAALEVKVQKDSLTGLFNKQSIFIQIKNQLKYLNNNSKAALFIIDIDNFKMINEQIGHLEADFIIKEVAQRIQGIFSHNDIIGRFGGDEYLVFIKNASSNDEIENKLIQLDKIIKQPYNIKNSDFNVSCSIGAAIYNKQCKNFDELFENADKALYNSKNKGKGCYSIYKSDY